MKSMIYFVKSLFLNATTGQGRLSNNEYVVQTLTQYLGTQNNLLNYDL